MAKKILIAMDESENSLRAVDFICTCVSPDATITLFSVLLNTEDMCAMQGAELTPYFFAQQSSFCAMENKKKELVSQALEKARQTLIRKGVAEDRVKTKIVTRKRGIARDIISEAKSGGYDLVVLGKRGLSGIKDFILGSVTQKVLHGVDGASLLLVD